MSKIPQGIEFIYCCLQVFFLTLWSKWQQVLSCQVTQGVNLDTQYTLICLKTIIKQTTQKEGNTKYAISGVDTVTMVKQYSQMQENYHLLTMQYKTNQQRVVAVYTQNSIILPHCACERLDSPSVRIYPSANPGISPCGRRRNSMKLFSASLCSLMEGTTSTS